MEFLSKRKFRNVCHVVWLRFMTVTKLVGNIVSIMISLYCYGYNQVNYVPSSLGTIYATVYFTLSCIDTFTEAIILYKVRNFLNTKNVNFTPLNFKIKHTEPIKWLIVLQSMFFLFITTSGILEFKFLVRIYGIDFTQFLMVFSLIYSGISILHLISFMLFVSR